VPKKQFGYDSVKDLATGKCFSGYLSPKHVQWMRNCADENRLPLKVKKFLKQYSPRKPKY
jgi:hypothetical protein